MNRKIPTTVRTLFALAGMLFFGATAALATQVDSGTWKKLDWRYDRSDGFYENANGAVALMGNAQETVGIGPTATDTFAYGAGSGDDCFERDWTACSATAGALNIMHFGNGLKTSFIPIVGQTIAPTMDAASLDIGCDQVDNDGLEMTGGGMYGSTGRAFIIGNDPAFRFCATVAVEDVSGTDDFHVGFRGQEAFTATFDDYNDLASIGPISGNITIATILNNGATTTTDTTDDAADAATVAYCVLVSGAGVVTYTINGVAPTTTAAFTFDDGDSVVPFIHYLQASDLTGEIDVTLWEVTYQ